MFSWIAHRHLDLTVEGREHVPAGGPVIVVARHYHHFYDGCALIDVLDRPVHIVVGLDWIERRLVRRGLEALCGVAQLPVILRTDRQDRSKAVDMAEPRRYLRKATAEAVGLLRGGGLVLVFPEGYPNVDPHPTPKQGPDDFLPFHPGFVQFAQLAQADGVTLVPIVPAGFSYERLAERGKRWRVTLRFGEPLVVGVEVDRAALVRDIEARVRVLSAPAAK